MKTSFLSLSLLFFLSVTSSSMAVGFSFPEQIGLSPIEQKIVNLYPSDIQETTLKRLSVIRSEGAFEFFRSFIPYYFNLFREDPELAGSLKALLNYQGLCVGDAHPFNFGTFLSPEGKVSFGINDPDDAAICPFALDFLRFMVAIDLSKIKDIHADSIILSYLAGLSGKNAPSAPGLDKWIRKTSSKGTTLPEKHLSSDGMHFNRQAEGVTEIDASLRADLIAAFKNSLDPSLLLLDAVKFTKWSGGSGGLPRYWFLTEKTSSGEKTLTEWKATRLPGAYFYSRLANSVEPLEHVLEWEQGFTNPSSFKAVHFKGNTFYSRPKWKGADSITFQDITTKDLNETLQFEAWTLGNLHRLSGGGRIDEYRGRLKTIVDFSPLSSVISEVSKKIQSDFKCLMPY